MTHLDDQLRQEDAVGGQLLQAQERFSWRYHGVVSQAVVAVVGVTEEDRSRLVEGMRDCGEQEAERQEVVHHDPAEPDRHKRIKHQGEANLRAAGSARDAQDIFRGRQTSAGLVARYGPFLIHAGGNCRESDFAGKW